MANTTILDLPTLTSPSPSDVFPVVNNGITKRISLFDVTNIYAIPNTTSNFIFVQSGNNAVTNGTNLLNAYTTATTLTPNASALSSTNRTTLVLMPGTYDLGSSSLNLNTQYVDIVGFTRDASHVNIISNTSGYVINQTANDVRCIGIALKNKGSGVSATLSSNLSLLYWENIIFDRLLSTSLPGTFINCSGNNIASTQGSFGSKSSILSGTFSGCSATNSGIGGGGFAGQSSTLSGKFLNCSASNSGAAGGGFAGTLSTLSGSFTNCNGTNSTSNQGGGFAADAANVSNAIFTNCIGNNTNSSSSGGGFFGVGSTIQSTTFYNCQGFNNGLAGGGFVGKSSISNYGTFYNCIGSNTNTWGGGFFGYQSTNNAKLLACKGSSSASDGYAIAGYLSVYKGQYINCVISDLTPPTLTSSGFSTKPACFINCLDGSGHLVNGSV